jgi:ABC-type multidrug transport system ATPase subunit
LLGSNGSGKSSFAKSCIGALSYSGTITEANNIVVIGSYSGIPVELMLKDIVAFLKKRFSHNRVDELLMLLQFEKALFNRSLSKMSDGQKQKIKLLSFLSADPDVIILDEFTTSLDKNTTMVVYSFLNQYIEQHGITCINITHNLSDLEYLSGEYFFLENCSIRKIDSKEEATKAYLKREIS